MDHSDDALADASDATLSGSQLTENEETGETATEDKDEDSFTASATETADTEAVDTVELSAPTTEETGIAEDELPSSQESVQY